MGVSIQQAVESDIPELVQVHSKAFKADQFSNFMLSGKPPGAHEDMMERSLKFWFSDPTVWLVKAVNDDGAIVGWVCWLTKTVEKAERKEEKGTSETKTTTATTTDTAASKPPPQAVPDTPARVIGRQMRNDSMKWETDSMTENKYLILQGLVTDPDCQRRGIGSQLVKWGVDRADAEKLPCWCHASPAGNQLYRKAGFQEMGNDEYDLGDFGKYTFRYMVRQAA
ncbi:hypothetical protein ABW21_db0204255 [Orbilia brochopaga]|nr:hypothetical protein ABW21_db0204255 [Drechslerella brochopaga]